MQVSSMEKVFPKKKPSSDGSRKQMSGLKGEIISFQIAYFSEYEGYTRAEAEVISPLCEQIKIRKVALVPCAFPCGVNCDEDYLTIEPGLYPDRLEELEKEENVYKDIPLIYGQWRSIWIDVELSESQNAGIYPITVKLTCKENVIFEEAYEIRVINAALPKLPIKHTEWFYSDCLANYYQVEVFSEEYWRIVENYLKTAAKHQMNMLLTPIFTPPLDTAVGGERRTVQLVDVKVLSDGNYEFGFEKLERWVNMAKRCGICYFEMSHLFTQWGAAAAPKIMGEKDGVYQKLFGWDTDPSGKEYQKFLHAFLQALKPVLEKLEITKNTYFHVSDEPSMEMLESYRLARKCLLEELQGYPMIDALSDYAFFREGLVEQPVCALDHIEPFLRSRANDNGPEKLWGYYCCGQAVDVSNRFIVHPGYRTRILGAQLYACDLAGFLHWGYNFYNSAFSLHEMDPYQCTDADGAFPSGDPFLVYPGKNGEPEESQRLMLMDEAMADFRAMKLLEERYGRDAVLECLDVKDEVLFLKKYPRNNEYLTKVREKINEKLECN